MQCQRQLPHSLSTASGFWHTRTALLQDKSVVRQVWKHVWYSQIASCRERLDRAPAPLVDQVRPPPHQIATAHAHCSLACFSACEWYSQTAEQQPRQLWALVYLRLRTIGHALVGSLRRICYCAMLSSSRDKSHHGGMCVLASTSEPMPAPTYHPSNRIRSIP